jgi:hypothetical protein
MDWVSFGDVHVSLLLAALAKSIVDNINNNNNTTVGSAVITTDEVKVAHVVSSLVVINLIGGALSASTLVNRAFWTVQMVTWIVLLVLLLWFTYAEYDEPMMRLLQQRRSVSRLDLLMASKKQSSSRRLLFESGDSGDSGNGSVRPGLQRSSSERSFTETSNTFDANGKIPDIAAIALSVVLLGHIVQIIDLINDSFQSTSITVLGYSNGDDARDEHFRNAVMAVLIRKCMVAIVLGTCLRFFDKSAQRMVLVAHTISLLCVEVMLAGTAGDAMTDRTKSTVGVGTFFMILTSIIGAV